MKKRIISILLLCSMVLTLLPTAAFAEDNTEESPVCTCETVCTAETMNTECSVCGADGALPESCAKANTGAIAEGTPAQALILPSPRPRRANRWETARQYPPTRTAA